MVVQNLARMKKKQLIKRVNYDRKWGSDLKEKTMSVTNIKTKIKLKKKKKFPFLNKLIMIHKGI